MSIQIHVTILSFFLNAYTLLLYRCVVFIFTEFTVSVLGSVGSVGFDSVDLLSFSLFPEYIYTK
jgi:hypothetical protein